MVNKQGQTRLSKYYNSFSVQERVTLEGELIRKCLSRTENQCSFLDHRQYKVIYRRYASLYFIIGIDIDDDINELGMLEFIHNMVETLDKYFENVCELDVSAHKPGDAVSATAISISTYLSLSLRHHHSSMM